MQDCHATILLFDTHIVGNNNSNELYFLSLLSFNIIQIVTTHTIMCCLVRKTRVETKTTTTTKNPNQYEEPLQPQAILIKQ